MEREDEVTTPRLVCQTNPGCLVCGGSVVPLRGSWRCVRCGYTICVGCEAVSFSDERESA